ncbi:MAG: phage portal protein [Oscillospiraceae bacterium]|nr:phage portal protein [Oscillospiraceae bacterium]
MISKAEIEKALKVSIPVSNDMDEAIRIWAETYENKAYWIKKDIVSLNLASEIASETSRLVTGNGKSWISGSARAEYLQKQYSTYMETIRKDVELGCALGGIALKPYLCGGNIKVDAVTADRFYPVSYDTDGELTSAVFVEQHTIGKNVYTRLEYHIFNSGLHEYTVENHAYVSESYSSLGKECSLSDVDMWMNYTELMHIRDVERPLFAYFKMPTANNIDRNSPTGISCFAKAIDQIKQADTHWALIMWEYDGSQLAIDAPEDMFKKQNGKLIIPERMQRLFRTNDYEQKNDDIPIQAFSPAIRDQSLFNGFNRILQRIEYNCDLAYGTISDPQTVEKTAEEVRSGKERSRSSMQEKQKSLENALKHLIWIMNQYADYYNLAPSGEYETVFEWGDGVTQDRDKEFSRQLQLVTAGKLKAEKLIAWYFGCSEEKAKEYIPETQSLFGGE